MKKIITVLAAAVVSVAAFAQIGVGAGYANSVLKQGDKSTSFDGVYVGATTNFQIAGALGVMPGVTFEYLMSNKSAALSIFSGDSQKTEMYIDVPVKLTFGGDVSKDLAWTVYAGPTASFGLSSTNKLTGGIAGLGTASTTTDNYKEGSSYGRFDVLVGGGIMIDFAKMLRFDAGYDYGLMNRIADADPKMNRAMFHVGVAYLF